MASVSRSGHAESIRKAINTFGQMGKNIFLKNEQEYAIATLLTNVDVMAILPTGFGKSLIFMYQLALEESDSPYSCSILIVSPLRSIIEDQIAFIESLKRSGKDLCKKSFTDIKKSPPDYFLDEMKANNSLLHQKIGLAVIDECHTVETWTGKRWLLSKFYCMSK